ncbi:MAG: GNAT family protein [Candidatus Omnitrophota bacterium]|nr:GNAT family protein [Candidatus Omnitrophota bacterium]
MINGKLVTLRAIEREDLPLIISWRNDPEVYRHYIEYEPLSMPKQERWFESILAHPTEKNLVVALPNGQAIGTVGLGNIDERSRVGEVIRFVMGVQRYRLMGHAVEALYLMLSYGFSHLNLHKIYATDLSTNPKMISMHQQFGFVQEAVLRQHVFHEGEHVDVVIMGLLRSEFQISSASVEEVVEALAQRCHEPVSS